ncbi:MAG TPA: penicillin-binding protein 1A [Casimicrobiaceae bacterium]|nr:penicillin-binding protein 1A [Casimicrobiaceae bacterium]
MKRSLLYVFSVVLGLGLVGALLGAFVLALLWPTLPSLEALTDYQPKIPLRVVSADGALLGEFGEERRAVVAIREVPDVMKHAILAAEDERFYSHGGVDYLSVVRAALANLSSGAQQGAGTITMQVARNFFLTREKTITRKMREALLAWKIEASLTKDEILELYVNQIFLGQRAYGFAAASQIYFGKPLKDITVAEAAMLAGLPKAPSAYNPVNNPRRAKTRQQYVLRRMHDLRFISDDQFREAQSAPLVVRQGVREALSTHAEFIAEMARQVVFDAYGEEAYTKGLTVWTTVRRADQEAAYAAVRRGVIEYDRRHGYRGPEAYVSLPDDQAEQDAVLDKAFQDSSDSDSLLAAVVVQATPVEVRAVLSNGDQVQVTGDGLKFAARALTDKAPAAQRIRRGAVIRVTRDDKGNYAIASLPQAEAAFLAVTPQNGAIVALVGGFDYDRNKFNHATQAMRQPGSAFKPFIYSAALEKGFSPSTVINDAPFFVPAAQAGGEDWEPKNYDGKFDGPMRLRVALAKSKNLVTVRVLQAIGPQYAQDYIAKFGFDPKMHPAYLTMGLGAGSATPMQMATAYSVFANGGYRITPYLIARITDARGNVLSEAKPDAAGEKAERVIDPRNAFIMTTLLRDVIAYGTATRALELKRKDLAGKTGTTNENVDAWFCGFNQSQVGIAWIGFDQPKTLGTNETGGVAALPIWIAYMQKALKGVPEKLLETPPNVVSVRINAESGLRDDGSNLSDWFYAEFTPRARESEAFAPAATAGPPGAPARDVRDQLF